MLQACVCVPPATPHILLGMVLDVAADSNFSKEIESDAHHSSVL